MEEKHVLPVRFPPDVRRIRLDQYLAGHFPDLSRSRIKRLIRDGYVLMDDVPVKAGYFLRGEEVLSVTVPEPEEIRITPESIPLRIIYEDDDLMLVDKPAGMVVHPARGNPSGTLVNAVLAYCRELEERPFADAARPGIVHRLDRNTSGLILVAKNGDAQLFLSEEFKERRIRKTYRALAWGRFDEKEGVIDVPIGRHEKNRKKMTVKSDGSGKDSLTRWEVLRQFRRAAHMKVSPHTGRTHQIRVHFQHIGHPVMGDGDYGGGPAKIRNFTKRELGMFSEVFSVVKRQMLHAWYIGFRHPSTREFREFTAPLPEDFSAALDLLAREEEPTRSILS